MDVNISIYLAAYRLESNLFDWRKSLDNYCQFAEQVVIATTVFSGDNTIELLKDYGRNNPKIKLEITNFALNTLDFDGNIKNAALQACSNDYCILLDLDEEIPVLQKSLWIKGCGIIKDCGLDGLLIPSINLCRNKYHYKDIGYKFYLHKKDGISRGILNAAKLPNGHIRVDMSDTTEPITNSGELGKFSSYPKDIEILRQGNTPYVFHDWASDFDQRIEQNRFWKPVWELRAGRKVDDIILDKKELEKIPVFPHYLPL